MYLGFHLCRHWGGVDRTEEKECCGGRRLVVAFVRCSLKGVVEAERECSSSACRVADRARSV